MSGGCALDDRQLGTQEAREEGLGSAEGTCVGDVAGCTQTGKGRRRCATDSECPSSAPSCVASICECALAVSELSSDEHNCGQCGNDCSSVDLGATCQQGRCILPGEPGPTSAARTSSDRSPAIDPRGAMGVGIDPVGRDVDGRSRAWRAVWTDRTESPGRRGPCRPAWPNRSCWASRSRGAAWASRHSGSAWAARAPTPAGASGFARTSRPAWACRRRRHNRAGINRPERGRARTLGVSPANEALHWSPSQPEWLWHERKVARRFA